MSPTAALDLRDDADDIEDAESPEFSARPGILAR
ncbi:hypothetical protein SRABI128_02560 [Microbacterium sp. Bi128]|nr:hypothetical protein SRABI128_02560 [Microbacterium sp. Bi128]